MRRRRLARLVGRGDLLRDPRKRGDFVAGEDGRCLKAEFRVLVI
jgi:hypothetical protein